MLEVTLFNAAQHTQLPLQGESLVLGGAGGMPLRDNESEAAQLVVQRVTGHGEKRVRITNRGQTLVLARGTTITPGATSELLPPIQLLIGGTVVFVEHQEAEVPHDAALARFPRLGRNANHFAAELKSVGGAPPSSRTLARWFDALGRLQRSPAGSQEFFQAAADAVIDPGGLDAGMVLLREGDAWRIAASHVSHVDPAMVFRRSLLNRIEKERQTLFHDARIIDGGGYDHSLNFVAAAPILDAAGAVVGVVYGTRFDHDKNNRRGIRPLEAHFVQAVADTVAAGLQRHDRELEVVRLRSRLELAFSPSVADELERNPQLLAGVEREVTILFCDLRGFTALSERLSPRECYALLGDVMDRVTDEVARQQGLVIDYFGDGLAAFWNAPVYQPDHASLACQAALAIMGALPDLSSDWFAISGRELRLGVGIHSGLALVGNAGSRSRIKYGPRGSAMILASRVERFTKEIGVPILITDSTARRLTGRKPLRQIARTRIEGFVEPIDLFQPLTPLQAARWAPFEAVFQEAWSALNSQRYEESSIRLAQLKSYGVSDPAVDYLARRLAASFEAGTTRNKKGPPELQRPKGSG